MFPFALPLFFWFTIDFFVEEVIISSYLSRLIMKEFPSIEKLDLIYHWYYFKPYFIVFIASYSVIIMLEMLYYWKSLVFDRYVFCTYVMEKSFPKA